MKNKIEIIGIGIMFVILILIADLGIKKNELRECEKWQIWEEIYPKFTASKSMKEQCERHNIKLK